MALADRSVRGAVRLTERDRLILAFAADQRVVLASHIEVLLESSAAAALRRLGVLRRAGYLERRSIFHLQPSCYLITSRGLAAIDSPLTRPTLDMRGYVHDLGLGWVTLAARSGALGAAAEVISERRMRSADGLPRSGEAASGVGEPIRYGVRLWAVGGGTHEQLHYPDVLLRREDGRRVALELELTGKSARRLEKIMNGYGSDRQIDSVLYLTDRPAIARRVQEAAARAGVSGKVQVQPFAWTPSMQRLVDQLRTSRGPARSSLRRAQPANARTGGER